MNAPIERENNSFSDSGFDVSNCSKLSNLVGVLPHWMMKTGPHGCRAGCRAEEKLLFYRTAFVFLRAVIMKHAARAVELMLFTRLLSLI